MRKKAGALVCMVLGMLLFGCSSMQEGVQATAAVSIDSGIAQQLPADEQQAAVFLETGLRDRQGLVLSRNVILAEPSASLLESMGQALEYAALLQDRALFDYYAQSIQQYFLIGHKYYTWKVTAQGEKKEQASALVDDLRVARAYLLANKRFSQAYRAELQQIAAMLLQVDVDTEGYPVDFYDGSSRKLADRVSLFYLDTVTMGELSQMDGGWRQPYLQANGILAHMPENTCGFYPRYYHISDHTYEWGNPINMVENIYTTIDAYQAGKGTVLFTEFLKKEIAKGKICNSYATDGSPAESNESAAVYALAARFLSMQQEEPAAAWCYARMKEFQLQEGKLRGGFGDSRAETVYAFDQLEALLAMRTREMKNCENK